MLACIANGHADARKHMLPARARALLPCPCTHFQARVDSNMADHTYYVHNKGCELYLTRLSFSARCQMATGQWRINYRHSNNFSSGSDFLFTEIPTRQFHQLIYILLVLIKTDDLFRLLPSLSERRARVRHLGMSVCLYVCLTGRVTQKLLCRLTQFLYTRSRPIGLYRENAIAVHVIDRSAYDATSRVHAHRQRKNLSYLRNGCCIYYLRPPGSAHL